MVHLYTTFSSDTGSTDLIKLTAFVTKSERQISNICEFNLSSNQKTVRLFRSVQVISKLFVNWRIVEHDVLSETTFCMFPHNNMAPGVDEVIPRGKSITWPSSFSRLSSSFHSAIATNHLTCEFWDWDSLLPLLSDSASLFVGLPSYTTPPLLHFFFPPICYRKWKRFLRRNTDIWTL